MVKEIQLHSKSPNYLESRGAEQSQLLISEGERCLVIETISGPSDESCTNILVPRNSSLEHIRIVTSPESSTLKSRVKVELLEGSSYSSKSFYLCPQKEMEDLNEITLKGEGAEASVLALSLVRPLQNIKHEVLVDHKVPHCKSQQLVKSIVSSRGRSQYIGRVLVQGGAIKSDSHQLSRHMLLGRLAEADPRPQLEIFNDDVKAAHGATVGQVNREELFYLQSRGLSPRQALELLSQGFADEIVLTVSEAARAQVSRLVQEAFQFMVVEL